MTKANPYDALDAVPIGVFILDEDLTVLFWNTTLEDWTSIRQQDIVGQPIEAFYPHLATGRYTSRLEGIFKGGAPTIFSSQLHQHILPIEDANGNTRIQHTIVTALENDNGEFDAMFSIQDQTDLNRRIQAYQQMRDEALHEVQERRQVEQALKVSEARYRDLSELISDFAFALERDETGTFQRVWVTDAFTYITGYSLNDFRTLQDWRQMIHPDDLPKAKRGFRTIEMAWVDERLEHRIITKTGEVRYMQIYLRPRVDPNTKQVTHIFGAAQDITRRKLAESKLRISEERFRQIAENLDVVIYIGDNITKDVSYANPAYERVVGQPRQRIYLNHRAYLPFIHAEDQENVRYLFETQAPHQAKQDITYRLRHGGNGELRWIRERRIPIEADSPTSDRFIALLEDVTNQKDASEREFAMALEREKIQLLSSFITDATHEFRTPLSVINSSLYLLGKSDDETKRERYTTLIHQQVTSISELVDVLVLMAGLDSNIKADHERIDVNSVFEMILDQFAVRLREARHIVTTEFYGAPLYISGQSTDIWQALVALVENAIRYTPENGKITLRSAKQGDVCILEVEDNGEGIPPEDQARIFDRFYRGDKAHSTRGFGLGLPLAKKIIERHGGTIELESEPKRGSLFRVVLPLMSPPKRKPSPPSEFEEHLRSSK